MTSSRSTEEPAADMAPSLFAGPDDLHGRVALAMAGDVADKVFPRERLEHLFKAEAGLRLLNQNPLTTFDSSEARAVLAQTDILVTCWGSPRIDDAALSAAPHLKLVAHAAGTVKALVAPSVWARGIQVSSAAQANAQPVAEFALAAILMAGKRVFELSRVLSARQAGFRPDDVFPLIGNRGKRVGIVGASMIGRRTIALLQPFDFEVVVYDPYLTPGEAERLGVESMGLEQLLAWSDIVSLHAPSLPETHHMIGREQIALLRPGTTLVNTARGALVDHAALADRVLRGELHAVLDHTDPEVLPPGHPFYDAENVFLTPHLAGSMGVELDRLAATAVDEAQRFVRGEPLLHQVRSADLARIA